MPPLPLRHVRADPDRRALAAWERRGARIVNRPAGDPQHRPRAHDRALRAGTACAFPQSVLVDDRGRARRRVPRPLLDQARRRARDARRATSASPATPAALAARPRAPRRARHRARRRPGPRARRPDQVLRRRRRRRRTSGRPSWFQWFYHRDQTLANHPFDPDALRRARRRGPRRRSASRSTAATRSSRPDGAHLRHRPERLAELRALPRRGRRAHRRAPRRAVPTRRGSAPMTETREKRNEVGPRSKTHRRARGAPHGAGPPVLRALLGPRDGARARAAGSSTRTATPTSTSSPASPSAASATATRTTSRRSRSRPRGSPSAASRRRCGRSS